MLGSAGEVCRLRLLERPEGGPVRGWEGPPQRSQRATPGLSLEVSERFFTGIKPPSLALNGAQSPPSHGTSFQNGGSWHWLPACLIFLNLHANSITHTLGPGLSFFFIVDPTRND